MSTEPELPQPQPQMPPPAQVQVQPTPDGRWLAVSFTIFFDHPNAGQLGAAMASLSRQMQTGLIIPQNGNLPPKL